MKVSLKISVLFLFVLLSSCNENNQTTEQKENKLSKKEIKSKLDQDNQRFSREEKFIIDSYISRRNLKMEITTSGLRYQILDSVPTGKKPNDGELAIINYEISLLNGDLIYDNWNQKSDFIIGHEDVEGGLQEGILLMREGETAYFIMPAHLAHGLLGDLEQIPPRSPLAVKVRLLKLLNRIN